MSASHHQEDPQISFNSLYCVEEHCLWDSEDSVLHTNCLIKGRGEKKSLIVEFLEQDLWEDDELRLLLVKEQEKEPPRGFEGNPFLVKARVEGVEWMLKVVGHYSFSALTAVLAVSYLDRFLCGFEFHGEKRPWVTQLAAVACLSLAAKVEETQVPLLLDLQVEDPKYVFEPKTIQRMEILVLSTLQWRMNPVTPLSFLEYIARSLKVKDHFRKEFLRRCECLLVSVISDCRFMCYLPSALATAIMVYVISSLEPCVFVEYQDQLLGILGINKDKVEDCCMIVQEVATSVDFVTGRKRKFGSMPESPKAVVDVSFSCDDTSNELWGLDSSPTAASVSSSPQPLSKKIKSQGQEESPN
ncbi:cyclin D3a [Striga asiatica]|uniref:Cyclin D3a n=1 Tax=Striga asiatica TaxID=4170 RepID=A0A5A7Q4S2_STRAF|nr:cyclin D3a [Striga asiatica]